MTVDSPAPQEPKGTEKPEKESMIQETAHPNPNTNDSVAHPWNLADTVRAKRVQDIQDKLKEGEYFVPTNKLAPILTRIFLSTSGAEEDSDASSDEPDSV